MYLQLNDFKPDTGKLVMKPVRLIKNLLTVKWLLNAESYSIIIIIIIFLSGLCSAMRGGKLLIVAERVGCSSNALDFVIGRSSVRFLAETLPIPTEFLRGVYNVRPGKCGIVFRLHIWALLKHAIRLSHTSRIPRHCRPNVGPINHLKPSGYYRYHLL
jgi:hypothetical protein